MLSLFSKGDSNGLQDKESNSFSVSSFLGLPSAPASSKKASAGAKDKAENYLDFTKELKELKSVKVVKPLDKKDKGANRDSKDVNRSSQPVRNESYDRAKEQRRDDDRSKRDSDGFTIKKKTAPSSGDGDRKLDTPIKKPIITGSLSGKPSVKSSTQPSSSKPVSSMNNRSGPVTAQAKGKSFNSSLERLPKSVPLGQSTRPSSGTGSVSKLGSSTMKPSGSSSMKPSGSQSSQNKPIINKTLSGKPQPSSMGSRPSGNIINKSLSGKPQPSSMGSRPSSQQPMKRPAGAPNGSMAKPSGNGTLSKAKPIAKVAQPPTPAVRYVNGRPVPIKGADGRPVEPAQGSNLGKRSGDYLPGSRYEPATFKSVFKGGPKKQRSRYDDSEDDDYDDDFIDDGDQHEEEADQELKRMFGKYRQRVERTRHLLDDVDNMEAKFDDIEQEEEVSKLIGAEEDRRQLEFIKREMEEEAARERERMKKRKLQID